MPSLLPERAILAAFFLTACGGSLVDHLGFDQQSATPPGGCSTAADCAPQTGAIAACTANQCVYSCQAPSLTCASGCCVPQQVAAGGNTTCAILAGASSSLRCWGAPVGATSGGSGVPAEVLAGFAPSRVAVGRTHACAVVSGQVRCWGANDQGQLGQATPASSSATPLDPVPEVADAFDVAVGDANSCAITSAGAVFCWGANPALGTGTGVVQVQGLVATEIASGTAHVCATTTTGITCWGADDHGQVGIVSSLPVPPTPVSFRGGALTPNVIATGESHSCTLVNNEVNCWGADAFGQLGNGGTTDTPVPQRVPLLNPTPVLAGGGGHTCAYYLGGTPVGGEDDPPTQQGLYCWGNNDQGQLGGSSTLLAVTTPTTPVPFASPEPVASLAAGSSHTCALMQSKALLCWGSNDQGQVGTGSTGGDVPTPTQVTSK